MRHNHSHTHQCSTCGDTYDCGGLTERNYDGGGGDWLCVSHYHGDTECEDCREAVRCDFCGTPIPTGGGKVIGGENEGIACDVACRIALESEHWSQADAAMAKAKYQAWQDAKAAERTKQREAEVARLKAKREADRALPDVICPF